MIDRYILCRERESNSFINQKERIYQSSLKHMPLVRIIIKVVSDDISIELKRVVSPSTKQVSETRAMDLLYILLEYF